MPLPWLPLALLALVPAADAAEPDAVFPALYEQAPGHYLLVEPVTGTLSPAMVEALIEATVGEAPVGVEQVIVEAIDGEGVRRPIDSFLPPVAPVPDKEVGRPRTAAADFPGRTDGFLTGKAVYLSQCHGWLWYSSLDDYSTQRGEHFDTVEDFHNPEALNQFLAPYLENAGASVYTVKERDTNPDMAIVDNGDSGYTETGTGFADGAAGFGAKATWDFGEHPFSNGGTRTFPADGGGSVSWVPDVPADGLYAVYVSWDSDSGNATDAHYRITHPGGVIDRFYDQTVHGSTWQYVETLWLVAGPAGLTVELLGDSSQGGKTLSADAVRVGGGIDDVVRYGDATERPRWESSAVQYTHYNGAPKSVYDPYGGNSPEDSDPAARSRWADWEHPSGEDALYLSWHSNACGTGDTCTARGTVTYIYDATCTSGAPIDGSYDLAVSVNDELVQAFRSLWEPGWEQRGGTDGVAEACFSEVSPSHNNEMPAALVELAFHNNETDTAYLREPGFRRDAARAMYRGIVRYWADRDGVTPSYLPEPPVDVSLLHNEGGRLVASWTPGASGHPYGDAAVSYLVQTSADGRSWDNGSSVDATSVVLTAAAGELVFVRVVGVNGGGVSFPSEVVGARRSPTGEQPILVVPAFDRFEASQLPWEDVPRVGLVRRLRLGRVNAFDVSVATGTAIANAGYYFETASDEAFDRLDLSGFGLIVWITGEESTADESFSSAQQGAVRSFVESGGALWVSGAELLWDLDYRGDASDKAFASQVLGVTYASDDAGTTVANGVGLLEGIVLDFDEIDGAPYPVEYPDTLTTSGEVIASYAGGGTAGALNGKVATFGIPFETIGDPASRDEVAARLLVALLPDYVPPAVPDPDTDDDGGWTRHHTSELRGCGCVGTPATPLPLLTLFGALVVRRRRR